MSDTFVEELLKRWGVPQLLDRFKEQELDLDALRSLEEEVIVELVPLIGPRCKFRKGWRAWQEIGAPTPSAFLPGAGGANAASGCPAIPSPTGTASSSPAVIEPEAAGTSLGVATQPAKQSLLTPSIQYNSTAEMTTSAADEHCQSDSDAKKEVSVFLEGKITYDGDASAGWLVADGFLSPPKRDGSLEGTTIKTEPSDEVLPSEMDATSHSIDRSSKRPRFQLQGRITLSLQDFVEVPSYMLSSALDDSSSMPPEGLSHQHQLQQQQFFQQMQQDSEAPSMLPFPSVSVNRPPVGPRQEDVAADGPPARERSKRSRNDRLDLEALLNSSSKGKMILSLHQQRGCLDGPARQSLTDLIIAEELKDDFNKRITSQRFQEIADTIVDVFPGENADTYYCNDRSFGDRPGGKGKLTSKYYNTRRQLAKTGVICRGVNKERRQTFQQGTYAAFQCTPEEEEIGQQSIKWLQSFGWHTGLSPQDIEIALERWTGCWKNRLLSILTPGHQATVYLDSFPIIRMPVGEKLIKADFDVLFPNAGNRLSIYWPNFSQSIISMLSEDYRKTLPLLDHVRRSVTTAEGKQVGALLLLPAMLPVTTCKGASDTSELWRPTRQEAQDGFLLQVKEESEVSVALERHWNRMRLMGQMISPLPVVVGQSLDKLQSAFVAIDESTAFYMPNALSAVDLCFKCFHALQVPYPPQAQNVWLFLQHAIYQIATPTDRVSVAVSSLLADFGIRPVPAVVSWDQVINPQPQPLGSN